MCGALPRNAADGSRQMNDDEITMNRGPDDANVRDACAAFDMAPQNAVTMSHEDASAIRTEWEVLYSVIEGIRNYVAQQDGSFGGEALCGALITATARMYASLQAVMRVAPVVVTMGATAAVLIP